MTTDVGCYAMLELQSRSQQTSVVMGPGVRQDDELMMRSRAELNRFPRIRHRRRQPAVDRDRLAVDIGRIVARQKQSHRREFVGLAGALQRIELPDLVL